MSNAVEIVGIILVVCGIIYTFLRGMGKLPVADVDEFESKILKIKGGPGIILIALGITLFLSSLYTPPTPVPVLTEIIVSPATTSVVVGGTQTFTAVTLDQFSNSIAATVTWSSSNTIVGTIDSTSRFTALSAGTTTITASSGSVSHTATVTVTQHATDSTSAMDCFQGIPKNRTQVMEEGTKDFELIGPLDSKEGPIVIKLTENNMSIGSIKLSFYSNNKIFKIEKIVDSKCQQIEEYSNFDRGEDKHVLQNFDSVQIQFGDNNYLLRLEYDGETISGNFNRKV
jgi:hypothetical protein